MRRTCLAVLVCAAVLVTTPGVAPAAEGDATLQRYARDTWASFVAMTAAEQRPAGRHARGRRRPLRPDLDDEHRRVPVERRRRREARDHLPRRARGAGDADAQRRSSTWSATSRAASSTTGTTTATASKLTKWPPTGADLNPILSSVDNGWLATGLRIVERSIPSLSARAGALYDSMDFGFYYVPE